MYQKGTLPEVPRVRPMTSSPFPQLPQWSTDDKKDTGAEHLFHRGNGNPQLLMLEEVYLRAKAKFEEYQLQPSLALLS